MRTTLDIADDVLYAAKERARRENETAGEVISKLVRQALTRPTASAVRKSAATYGFEPFPPRGNVITNALIDKLRSEDANI